MSVCLREPYKAARLLITGLKWAHASLCLLKQHIRGQC